MRLPNIDPEVWASRPLLKGVQTEAHRRGAGADAVLWSLLVSVAAHIPARVHVDTGIGVPVRPTLYAVLAGASGSGKSLSWGVARGLLTAVPEPLPLSTGEGLVESFYDLVLEAQPQPPAADGTEKPPKMVKVRRRVRSNALFWLDEGETLFRQMEKTGNVVGPTLRAFWSGGTVGQANATADSRRSLAAGTYTGGLVVGLQPDISGRLLADTATGTAQRFVWVGTADRYLVDDPSAPLAFGTPQLSWAPPLLPGAPSNLEQFLTAPKAGQGWEPPPELPPVPMTLDYGIARRIRTEQIALRRGDVEPDEQDTQRTAMTVKVAAVLAWLDSRLGVSADDWQLAGALLATSDQVRAALLEHAERVTARDRAERGAERAQVAQAEDRAKARREGCLLRVREVMSTSRSIDHRDLGPKITAAQRQHLADVLTELSDRGEITIEALPTGGRRYKQARLVTDA